MTDETPVEPDVKLDLWANRNLSDEQRKTLLEQEALEPQAPAGRTELTVEQIQQLPERWRPNKNRTLFTRGRFVRPWGLRHALYAVAGLIIVQAVAIVGILAAAFASIPVSTLSNPDPMVATDALSKKLMELIALPQILLVLQLSMYVVWVAIMLWATYRKGLRSFAKDFWVRFRWFDPLLGIAIAWGLLALSQALTVGIEALFPHNDYSGLDNGATLTNFTGVWFWVLGIGIVGIVGPISEELFFRGLLLQGLRRWFNRYASHMSVRLVNVLAVVISSIAFGAVHLNGTANLGQELVPFLTGGIGLVLGFIVLRSKRMGINMFTHMAFNTTSVILGVILASH